MLTRGAGPACLLLVVLSSGIRTEPSVAVKPAAAAALTSLLLEPVFNAYVLGNAFGAGATGAGHHRVLGDLLRRFLRRKRGRPSAAAAAAASAVARARWMTAGAQLALWVAVMLAYAQLSLRISRSIAGPRRTVAGYMAALRALAAKKRGNGGWVRIDQWGKGGGGGGGRGGGAGTWGDHQGVPGQARARAHSLLGSLYERLSGGGWGGAPAVDVMTVSGAWSGVRGLNEDYVQVVCFCTSSSV